MDAPIGLLLLVQLGLIALNAVFASAETAVISMNDVKLAKLAADGDKRALRLTRLTSQPARFLATIQIAITLSGFLGSALAADNFSDVLVDWLLELGVGVPRSTLDTIAVILITLVLSYFTLVLGELVPKRVAMHKAEGTALGLSGLISGISVIFKPVVWFLTASTNLVLRLMGIDPNVRDDEVGEEEIRMMVDVGSQKGTIDPQEKELIQNVFEFDDLSAGEISVHRTEMDVLWMEDSDQQWETTIRQGDHSIYPVCEETVDNVVGILRTKKYFRMEKHDRESVMQYAVESAYFVPENVKADVLFRNMKHSHNFFAVVLDEYGGVSGIVTMNDLLERLVGDFEPESQTESAEACIEKTEHDGEPLWYISGSAELEDVEKELGVSLGECDCETFGGYVFGLIGAIPEDGCRMELETEKLYISIESIEEHQLLRSTVRKKNLSADD